MYWSIPDESTGVNHQKLHFFLPDGTHFHSMWIMKESYQKLQNIIILTFQIHLLQERERNFAVALANTRGTIVTLTSK